MANVKISELPVATSLSNGDSFPVVQGGVTKQAARSVLFASPTFTGATTADLLTATGDVTFDGGAFVFNESGADKDARFEGDTDANLLFLDASMDRVGIGTAAPAAKLAIDAGANALAINFNSTDASGVCARFQNSGTSIGDLGAGASVLSSGAAGDFAITSRSGNLVFGTGTNERMRLTTSGEFYVGANNGSYFTSEGARVFPTGSANSSFVAFTNNGNGGTNLALVNSNGSTTSWNAVVFQFNTTSVGSITCTPTTTSYNQSSDRRLKTAVAPAADAGALLDAVQVVEFDWKVGGHVRYGVIAQDLHLIAPEVVTPGDSNEEVERPWGVDYSKLVPMLIKEVQSLRARVAALEAG